MAKNRNDQIREIIKDLPAYRWQQIRQAFFNPKIGGFSELSNLPLNLRSELSESVPWMTLQEVKILKSKEGTYKALLKTADDKNIETVLMPNAKDQFTICLSSQIGCASGCLFCATATMGFSRNLSYDELIDQVRFWQKFVYEKMPDKRISNMVVMGMGEPLLNYDNLKTALNEFLLHQIVGQDKITVSTVGIIKTLNELLDDKGWPNVRLAVSLHAPDFETRIRIVPLTTADFFASLTEWCINYLNKLGNRSHYLCFEYIMIKDLNDSKAAAVKLAKLVKKIGNVKINLIPFNEVNRCGFQPSSQQAIDAFFQELKKDGITVTVRKSLGQDIKASCGQLATGQKD